MSLLHSGTVRGKLLVVALLTSLAALVTALSAVIAFDLRTYHNSLIDDMATQSELLGYMTAPALSFDDRHLAEQNLGMLKLRPKVRMAAIYDAHGQLFASYMRSGERESLPQKTEADDSHIDGGVLRVFKTIRSEGEPIGVIFLAADYEFGERLATYLGIAAIVIMVGMAIAYLLSSQLQRVVTDPIRAISEVAREVVVQRDYSRRAQRQSDDEVGFLVGSFNDMLAEIERRTEELENSNREIAHEVAERRAVQQEVMRLNMDLEDRVLRRTAELELANAELEQAKLAAERANQAKSAFLSSMSHELRTPLNAVLGFTQLMMVKPAALSPERIEEYSNHIMKAGEHLLVLINEVLDLAKVESGAVSLSMEPVAIDGVLGECKELLQPIASHRGISLRFPENDCRYVAADRTRLKQVLLNLLSNAIKYNREHGNVTVECSETEPGSIRIAIRDTGAGLRPDQLEQLFQPFNRLGQEASATEGTGIGLVVTRRLVEMMGGSIGVNSTVGVGSEFWIEMDVSHGEQAVAVSEVLPVGPGVSEGDRPRVLRTVLYVEDNPVNLKLVQEVVSYRTDLRLMTATDGSLGIELARAHLPDIILLDINLPGISGHDAFKILQQDEGTRHIPVIAVTANAMPKDIEKGLAMGYFRYLTKPIKINELLDALDQAVDLVAAPPEK